MTTGIRLRKPLPPSSTPSSSSRTTQRRLVAMVTIFFLLFLFVMMLALSPESSPSPNVPQRNSRQQSFQQAVQHQREQISQALASLTQGNIPHRLRKQRDQHQIVGERLAEVKQGQETVQEILHGHDLSHHQNDRPPMQLQEIIQYLDQWIHTLHETLAQAKHANYEGIWQAYHDLTVKTLYPWDRDYLRRMPTRRDDGSIFLSVATYRDENCFNTLYNAYAKSKDPHLLFVGLIQQNCHANCRSGVLANLSMVEVPPDDDCYQLFCQTELGQPICANHQVRVLNIDEPESLGPYAARYFASKLWDGEQWFMQIDAHMTFATHWDATSIEMLHKAPSNKPILSHYPPSHLVDLDARKDRPGARLCGPVFATSDLESQIIRLEGGGVYDKQKLDVPAFAPFTAAGYFVAHSDFLREVPFDPFLPWIFMGEEIIMSSRLWTAGYDIFSPSESVVGHIYVRRHKPKFWESVHRAFTFGVHNPLQMLVLDRIKYQLGYPEAAKDFLQFRSILTAVEQYSMGTARPLEAYLRLVGLNMTTKQVNYTGWCEEGYPPPGFEQYSHLYPNGRARERQQI